jgi:hypothetical protein
LSVRFRREERAEQFRFRFLVDALARIGYLQAGRTHCRPDIDLSVPVDGFGGILDNIDQDLLE